GELVIAGEIDAHTAPALAEAITGAGPDLTIDMSGIEFVDSSGLRVLIDAHQAAESGGGSLTLSNPSPAVTRLLEISGVVDYLNVRT
ncbi:MAG: STAS domain-containing protein, partial [Ilumatobacteraceae bacterium]